MVSQQVRVVQLRYLQKREQYRVVKSHLASFKEGKGLTSLQSLLLPRAFPLLFHPCLDLFFPLLLLDTLLVVPAETKGDQAEGGQIRTKTHRDQGKQFCSA